MVLDIQGIQRPSGEIYSFEECLRRNRYLEKTIFDMRDVAEEFTQRVALTGTVFVCNTIGSDRDSCTIGFEYPIDKSIEDELNRAFARSSSLEGERGS